MKYPADDGLEVPHQPSGCLIVPDPDPANEFVKRKVLRGIGS